MNETVSQLRQPHPLWLCAAASRTRTVELNGLVVRLGFDLGAVEPLLEYGKYRQGYPVRDESLVSYARHA